MTRARRSVAWVLVLALLTPAISVARQPAAQSAASESAPSTGPSGPAQNETSSTAPQRSRAARRSYEREVHARHRHHISKAQVAMMAAVAGTSMGIGAIAGGGVGLAIGAIVGGWSAYAVHRLWNHLH